MLDRLAAVLGAQRRFVADAAHELRTPLTALGGMVEMLQLGADPGRSGHRRRMLDTMDREIGRLGPAGHRPADPLAPGCRANTCPGRGRACADRDRGRPPDAAPRPRAADPRGDRRLANRPGRCRPPEAGLDQPGGQRARVHAAGRPDRVPPGPRERARPAGGHGYWLRDRARRAAERDGPLRPGRPFTRPIHQARGLGLAIAREIVEAHGGAIVLESELGRGTSAIVELPLTEPLPSSLEASRVEPFGDIHAEVSSRATTRGLARPDGDGASGDRHAPSLRRPGCLDRRRGHLDPLSPTPSPVRATLRRPGPSRGADPGGRHRPAPAGRRRGPSSCARRS